MNKVKQLGNSLVILLFAGLLVSVTAQSEETESVIVSAQGHGVITSGIEKVKITTALVVLRKNGTAMITVTSDLQLQFQGSWKANTASPENILLTITGGALDGDLDGSGTLLLINDRKSLKELTIKANSEDGREITISFIADNSEPSKALTSAQSSFEGPLWMK
jgi:hypothetical protein